MPREVEVGDVTIRDGFQHLESFISTRTKIAYAKEAIFAGARHIEVTNLGNPKNMPQFADAEEILRALRADSFKRACGHAGVDYDELCITAVTIREASVDRAIQLCQEGVGPDRILMMVSTDEKHHKANSGILLDEYWKEGHRVREKSAAAGLKMCGTVSTIWGSPYDGVNAVVDEDRALEFVRRWINDIGVDDVEHADHDGSASSQEVFRYFSRVLDEFPDTRQHIAHFHDLKRQQASHTLAALQAGVTRFEAAFGGLGGQPANWIDDGPVKGTGDYYYRCPEAKYVGLQTMEDLLVQLDEMNIYHGWNIEKCLEIGKHMEKTVGFRLRSDVIYNGRTPHKIKYSKNKEYTHLPAYNLNAK